MVLVHGGGRRLTLCSTGWARKAALWGGLRYTDRETMDVVQMVLAGKVNKDLVQLSARAAARRWGLCGLDGRYDPRGEAFRARISAS